MFMSCWFPWRLPRQHSGPRLPRSPRLRRSGTSLTLEQLEDRTLLSSYSAATVSDLIADINAANKAGGTNTITLTAPTTSPYVLTAVDNTKDGPTGLPVIGGNKGDNVTIVGNGDIIERSSALGTADFRLFDVASGASLTLENLTLQNGVEFVSTASAQGGAIYNQGTLVLSGVTVQNNNAEGGTKKGFDAAGGGIWSNGSLTIENGTIMQNNQAMGGAGVGNAFAGALYVAGGTVNVAGGAVDNNAALGAEAGGCLGCPGGGGGFGGAIYINQGSINLTGVSLINNSAKSPGLNNNLSAGGGIYIAGGTVNLSNDTVNGNQVYSLGPEWGGGIYIAAGTVTLCNDTVEFNTLAYGGYGGGIGIGGGTVYIDAFTVSNTINNTGDNIDGTYIPRNC